MFGVIASFFRYRYIRPMSKTEKPSRGRPSTGLDKPLLVRLRPEQHAALRAWAKAKGISAAEAARQAIDKLLGN